VYHGYTLTSKIPFQSIITCVKHYLDDNPDTLPIILSLENHCSHPFQEQMAAILNNTLGDKLYIPTNNKSDSPLPSPLELVGKVVIKGKRPPENDDDDLTTVTSESMEEEDAVLADAVTKPPQDGGGNILKTSLSGVGAASDKLMSSVHAVSKEVGADKLMSSMRGKSDSSPPLPKIVPELAQVTLMNGVKFKTFSKSIDLPNNDMHSFSETKILKVLNKDPANVALWREYNQMHLTRCYPAGGRVDSSNYNPVVSWHLGNQLVALNFQTANDSAMNINDGRFRGGCGYVHKPPNVLSSDGGSITSDNKMILRIKVLSGSCLPKPYGDSAGEVIDPYVIVRLHDVDKASQSSSKSLTKRPPSGQDDWLETTTRKTKSIRYVAAVVYCSPFLSKYIC